MALSPLNQRRWRNFKANRRAYWSLIIFSVLFGVSLFAEVLANDRPLLVNYRGEWRMPFVKFYSEDSLEFIYYSGHTRFRADNNV